MGVKDLWDKVTGQKPEERPLTKRERAEAGWQRELNDINARASGQHPDRMAYLAQQEKAKERAGQQADMLQKPGPSERMVSYKDLFTEPTREVLKESRETKAAELEVKSEGKRPPIQSYSERNPNETKDRGR